jgi:hypothetical protein
MVVVVQSSRAERMRRKQHGGTHHHMHLIFDADVRCLFDVDGFLLFLRSLAHVISLSHFSNSRMPDILYLLLFLLYYPTTHTHTRTQAASPPSPFLSTTTITITITPIVTMEDPVDALEYMEYRGGMEDDPQLRNLVKEDDLLGVKVYLAPFDPLRVQGLPALRIKTTLQRLLLLAIEAESMRVATYLLTVYSVPICEIDDYLIDLIEDAEGVPHESKNPWYWTPLGRCIMERKKPTMALWLIKGPCKFDVNHINQRCPQAGTCLHLAVEYDKLDIVKALVHRRGADITLREEIGLMRPIDVAALLVNIPVLEFLSQCYAESPGGVKQICEALTGPDEENGAVSIFHICFKRDMVESLAFLVDKLQVDLSRPIYESETTQAFLHHKAAVVGAFKCLDWLLQQQDGAALKADRPGNRLYHYLCMAEDTDKTLVRLFMRKATAGLSKEELMEPLDSAPPIELFRFNPKKISGKAMLQSFIDLLECQETSPHDLQIKAKAADAAAQALLDELEEEEEKEKALAEKKRKKKEQQQRRQQQQQQQREQQQKNKEKEKEKEEKGKGGRQVKKAAMSRPAPVEAVAASMSRLSVRGQEKEEKEEKGARDNKSGVAPSKKAMQAQAQPKEAPAAAAILPAKLVEEDNEEAFQEWLVETAPDTLVCPITHSLFREPVMALDGHLYEKEKLEEWISTCAKKNQPLTSPRTGALLQVGPLVICHGIRTMVREFEEGKRKEWEETGGGKKKG